MTRRHLTDTAAARRCTSIATPPGRARQRSRREHVDALRATCQARGTTRCAELLDDVGARPRPMPTPRSRAERLARQHARIMQRVEQDVAGRRASSASPRRTAPVTPPSAPAASRWVAAAAAAGARRRPRWASHLTARLARRSRGAARSSAGAPAAAARAAIVRRCRSRSDDEFLRPGRAGLRQRRGPAALRPLDALTPRGLGRPRVVRLCSPLIFRKGLDRKQRSRARARRELPQRPGRRASSATASATSRAGSPSTSRASSASATASTARWTTPTRRARASPIARSILTGEIIHNPHVNDQLRAQGIRFLTDPGESIERVDAGRRRHPAGLRRHDRAARSVRGDAAARWWTPPAARC